MFKLSPKTVSLSFFESIIKHQKEIKKQENKHENIDNWIQATAKKILEQALEERSKYNRKNSYRTSLVEEEEIFKALQKAMDTYASVLTKEKIKS